MYVAAKITIKLLPIWDSAPPSIFSVAETCKEMSPARYFEGVYCKSPSVHSSSNKLNNDVLFSFCVSISYSLSVLEGQALLAVNQEYIEKEQKLVLSPGDEVAVIPPISGG